MEQNLTWCLNRQCMWTWGIKAYAGGGTIVSDLEDDPNNGKLSDSLFVWQALAHSAH